MKKILFCLFAFLFFCVGVNAVSLQELVNLRDNDDSFSFQVNGSFEGMGDGTYEDLVYSKVTVDEAYNIYNTITDSYLAAARQRSYDASNKHDMAANSMDASISSETMQQYYAERVKTYMEYSNLQLIKSAMWDKLVYEGSDKQKCDIGLTQFCGLSNGLNKDIPFDIRVSYIKVRETENSSNYIEYSQAELAEVNKEYQSGAMFSKGFWKIEVDEQNQIDSKLVDYDTNGTPIHEYYLQGRYNPESNEISAMVWGKSQITTMDGEPTGDWLGVCEALREMDGSVLKAKYDPNTGKLDGTINFCNGAMIWAISNGTMSTSTPIVDTPEECEYGYVMENGVCVPENPSDVNVKVTPLAADNYVYSDGRGQLSYNIKGTYNSTPVELDFQVGYTTGPQKGTIQVSGNKNNYTVTYTAPDVKSFDAKGFEDYLYISYVSPKTGEAGRENYKIQVYVPSNNMLIIKKAGFKDQQIPLKFQGPTAKVTVVTKGPDNKEIPVNQVEITHSEYFTKYTDKAGVAIIEAPEDMEGSVEIEMNVLLELEDELVKAKKDAWNMYNKLLTEKNISENGAIRDFIVNYPVYLANKPQEYSVDRKVVSAMLRLPTALAIINSSNKTAEDAAGQIAESWTSFASDVKGLLLSFDKIKEWTDKIKKDVDTKYDEKLKEVSEKLTEKLKTKKIYDYIKEKGDQLGIERFQTILSAVKEQFIDSLLKKYENYIVIKSGDIDPDKLKKFLEEMKKKLLGENFVKDTFEKFVKDYYKKEHAANNDKILTIIATSIKEEQWPDYSAIDEGKKTAMSMYNGFVELIYANKHEAQYKISWFKDVGNWLIESIGDDKVVEKSKIPKEIIEKTKTLISGIDKAWKTFKVVMIDTVLLYEWYDAYGENLRAVNEAALWAMQIDYRSWRKTHPKGAFLFQSVHAEEQDLLGKIYENDMDGTEVEQEILMEFTDASVDMELFDTLLILTEGLQELDETNDPELTEMRSYFQSQYAQAKTIYDLHESSVNSLKMVKGESGWTESDTDMMIGLVFFLILFFITCKILKKFSKNKFMYFIYKLVLRVGLFFIAAIIVVWGMDKFGLILH